MKSLYIYAFLLLTPTFLPAAHHGPSSSQQKELAAQPIMIINLNTQTASTYPECLQRLEVFSKDEAYSRFAQMTKNHKFSSLTIMLYGMKIPGHKPKQHVFSTFTARSSSCADIINQAHEEFKKMYPMPTPNPVVLFTPAPQAPHNLGRYLPTTPLLSGTQQNLYFQVRPQTGTFSSVYLQPIK